MKKNYNFFIYIFIFLFAFFAFENVQAEDFSFERNLREGTVGEDVRQLQKFLNSAGFNLSCSGFGSIGNETDYFGEKTKTALVKFQDYNKEVILNPLKLESGTGFFGPYTRESIKNGTWLKNNINPCSSGIVSSSVSQEVFPVVRSGFVKKRSELDAPIPNIQPGSFTSAQNISLSSEEGSTIYYTTDGSVPTSSSTLYTNAINIALDTTVTIKAIAIKHNYIDSNVFSGTYEVISPTRAVSGTIQYSNLSNSDFHDVTIYLKQNGNTVYTTSTPSTGTASYSFSNVAVGTYDVYFSTNQMSESISAIDSAVVNSFISDHATMTGVRILAGDVYENSPNSIIDSNDVTRISSFFLNSGDPPFDPGNVVFVKEENRTTPYSSFPIQFAAAKETPAFSNMTLTVGDSDLTQNFFGLCYGDVNQSYSPL